MEKKYFITTEMHKDFQVYCKILGISESVALTRLIKKSVERQKQKNMLLWLLVKHWGKEGRKDK